MIDLLLSLGLSNVLVSAGLALLAWSVQASGKRPVLAHLLWLLVLVKLVTPPLWSWSLLEVPRDALSGLSLDGVTSPEGAEAGAALEGGAVPASDAARTAGASAPTVLGAGSWLEPAKRAVLLVWLLGSLAVLGCSLAHVLRFQRLLLQSTSAPPPQVEANAEELAARLGLRRVPQVVLTAARVSPMVWWTGGSVRVVLPAHLLEEVAPGELRWVLAHELAHVRRRDHMVRWLEWFACVAFWWNPIAWWARRNLRAHEEICCDALVLSRLQPDRRGYAAALLSVFESLTQPVLRPPAMACELHDGGFLETRFQMIVSDKSIPTLPRRVRALFLTCAAALLPLGVATAQEPDYDAVVARLEAAVEAGEITGGQAWAMIGALRGESGEREGRRALTREALERSEWRLSREPSAPDGAELRRRGAVARASREQALDRLEEARRLRDRADATAGRRITREEYTKHAAELKAGVEAGRISEEAAKRHLEELRRKMGTEGAFRRERADFRVERWEPAESRGRVERLDGADRSGRVERRDGAELRERVDRLRGIELRDRADRLEGAELRQRSRRSEETTERRRRGRTVDPRTQETIEELRAEILAGRLTREQANAQLAELRARLTEQEPKRR